MGFLPPELFVPRGVRFVVGLPVSETDGVAIERLHVIRGEYVFVPLFTSDARAADYAARTFGEGADGFGPLALKTLRHLGELLDALAAEGCQYVVFDPGPGVTSFAIGDVAFALREHVLRPSDN